MASSHVSSTMQGTILMTQSSSAISRRRFLATSAAAAAAACLNPNALWPQAPPAQQAPDFITKSRAANANNKITITPLRRNVTFIGGAGGNIALLTTKHGKLLVDSGYSSCQSQLAAALVAINADPISVLINTHWHLDHTDGNDWMHSAGATIWAHENTRYRMSSTQHIAAFDATFPPAPTGALPTILFNSYRSLSDGDNTLMLTHYGPSHTDTDLSVYFTEADIFHCGDTWFNGFYPFIDYSTGGSINGMIAAAGQNLAAVTDKTIIIPGHGPVGNRAQLTEFHDMLVGVRDNVAKLKKDGKSLDETIAAKPTAAYDEKWGKKPSAFIGYVYQGV
jgi:glyoxylase-like metal-dependent hydrolase (beta-lactamase superfamily II)